MRIQMAAGTDDGHGAILDLYQWLRLDPEISSRMRAELTSSRRSDETMGGGIDTINMILTHGFEAVNLAMNYASWRTARPAAPQITIVFAGQSIPAADASEETVRRIVEALQSAMATENAGDEADDAEEAEEATVPPDGGMRSSG